MSLFNVTCEKDITDMVKKGAIPNFVDSHGNTALHKMVSRRPDLVCCLLDNGVDPDIRNTSGKLALHYARDEETIDMLMKKCKKVTGKDLLEIIPENQVFVQYTSKKIKNGFIGKILN